MRKVLVFFGLFLFCCCGETESLKTKSFALSSGPVAYYSFTPSNNQITDDSGNGHTATLNNGSLLGLSVDGDNDYLKIPEADNLKIQNEITISLWVSTKEKPTLEQRQLEFLFRRGTTIYFGLEKDSVDNKDWLRFGITYTGGTTQEAEFRQEAGDAPNVSDGEFYHIAAMFKQNDKFKLYINGSKVDDEAVNKTEAIKLSTSQPNDYIIGARMKSDGVTIDRNIKAVFKKLRIYNTTLTDQEISDLYSNGG